MNGTDRGVTVSYLCCLEIIQVITPIRLKLSENKCKFSSDSLHKTINFSKIAVSNSKVRRFLGAESWKGCF